MIDEPRRNLTTEPLTGPQEVALAALVSGSSLTVAAERAGVSRQSVSAWCNHAPAFIAALRTARAELRAEQAGRLAALGARALGALDGLLDAEDPRTKLEAVKVVLTIAAPPAADRGAFVSGEEIAEAQAEASEAKAEAADAKARARKTQEEARAKEDRRRARLARGDDPLQVMLDESMGKL